MRHDQAADRRRPVGLPEPSALLRQLATDAAQGMARSLQGGDQTAEIVAAERDVRCLDGNVGAAARGDADLRPGQGRRMIDTVLWGLSSLTIADHTRGDNIPMGRTLTRAADIYLPTACDGVNRNASQSALAAFVTSSLVTSATTRKPEASF